MAAKNKTYEAVVNGKSFTVIYQARAKLQALYRNEKELLFGEYSYAAEQAVHHILSKEEVIARVETEMGERFYNSDAYMFAEEELDLQALTELSHESILERIESFTKVCHAMEADSVLQRVAELMPKKKNGFLYNRRTMPLTALMAVSKKCKIAELVAKAASDTEIRIVVQERQFSAEEYQKIVTSPLAEMVE